MRMLEEGIKGRKTQHRNVGVGFLSEPGLPSSVIRGFH